MIGEFNQHAVMRLPGQEPHAFRQLLHRHRRRRGRAGRRRGGCGGRRRKIAGVAVHGLRRQMQVGRHHAIDRRRQAGRQFEAADIPVVGEGSFHGDVAEIQVVGHRDDAGREPGAGVDRQREGLAGGRRDIDDALRVRGSGIGERGRRVERRANEDQRVVMKFGTAILRDRVRRARPRSIGRDVVRDVAVEAEHLTLRRLTLEVGEVRRARLFGARPPTGEINRAFESAHDKSLNGPFRRQVLTQVPVGAVAFDDQRLDGEDPVAPAERRRGVVHDLLFDRRARAGADETRCDEDEPPCVSHVSLLNASSRRHTR